MKLSFFRKLVIVLLLGLVSGQVSAKDFFVSLPDVQNTLKKAQPGDRILVSDGVYRDVQLKWRGLSGEGDGEKQGIMVMAEHPGGVVVTGRSSLRLAGSMLTVSGINFSSTWPEKGSVVEFRIGKDLAYNCRFTNCVINDCNPSRRDEAYSYILLYGKHNRVDHCSLTGKLNLGVTLIVILNDERCLENYHRIDHNWFGPRPVYGSNGAETMRIGTSQQAYSSSRTIVEDNLFERCNGEVEVISVKSSDNIIRNNSLYECEGVIALRHGDRNIVNGNVFIGNSKRNTGGVRIVNAAHQVYDNRFYGVSGTRFFSALAVMDAVPNSLPNRYCQVTDTKIHHNLFVNCSNIEFGTGKDLERTQAPERNEFTDNVIINQSLTQPYIAIDSVDGFLFKGNKVQLSAPYSAEGFVSGMKFKVQPQPELAELRKGRGADFIAQLSAGVEDISCQSDTTIYLSPGEHLLTEAIVCNRKMTICSADPANKAIIRFVGERPDNMITIGNGANLTVRDIIFDGRLEPKCAVASATISTAKDMISTYRLRVENCEFKNNQESGFFAIKGVKGTFADSVVIRNCIFRDLSGDGINYAAENDDKGRYSADDMIIEGCSFYNMLGLPINIYRGGSDESTAGPYVHIRDCHFYDSCNKERGSAIRAIGPQVLSITDCGFNNSGRGGASIRLDEAVWEKITLDGNTFTQSGRIIRNYNEKK